MKPLLQKLGIGRLLYKFLFHPLAELQKFLSSDIQDIRELYYWRLKKNRQKIYRNTNAAKLDPKYYGTTELLEIIKQDNRPTKVIWDIGAHTGTWSVLARSLFPDSTIVAVEPLPEHYSLIKQKQNDLGKFTLIEAAVGSTSGTLTLYRTNATDSTSALPLADAARKHFQLEQSDSLTAQVITLDDILQKTGQIPDLIKMDVQGFELEVLKGGTQTLQNTRYIIAELSFQEMYRGQPLAGEIIGWLHQHGFIPVALGGETEGGVRLVQNDMLFEKIPTNPS
jgi:FkbM family methyltransferase